MHRILLVCLSVFLVALFGGRGAQADEGKGAAKVAKGEPADPAILTLKDLWGGGRTFTKSIPGWRWRPGHTELVRLDIRKPKPKPSQKKGAAKAAKNAKGKKPKRVPPKPILVTMDPVTGVVRDLLDLSTLNALVPDLKPGKEGKPRKKKVRSMRGVGRRGAARFTWSKDGACLCVVVKGDLVWVDLESGAKRRLTHTQTPMADLNIAPDGMHVSFSRDHDLWVVATQEGKPYAVTKGGSKTLLNGTLDWVYPEELGFRTAAWWSPDSRRIAYLQMDQSKVPTYRVPGILPLRSPGREMFYPKAGDPNPKVRVGIVPVAGGETTWVADAQVPSTYDDTQLEYVVRVLWDPGNPAIPLVILANRQQSTQIGVGAEDEDNRAAKGWLSTPRTRYVAPWVRVERWDPDSTGWLCWDNRPGPPVGETSGRITPPGIDATSLLHYDVYARTSIYQGIPRGSATQGVFLGGHGVKALVRAPFAKDPFLWTSAVLDESATYALVTTQNATTPPCTVVARVADGKVIRQIGSAHSEKLDVLDLAVPEYGAIPVGELGKIRWRLWKPRDFDPKKSYGLIVHTYGGPGSRMVRNTWGRGPLMATMLCQRGFLVLEADGRGTSGQGVAWTHSVYGKLGILEIEDQATAVQHILKRGYVDPARVGIWGWSYGGTMACNALTMRGDVFKAGVAVASVTDWRLYDSIYTERYMGLPKDNPEGYKQSSAITHAKKMKGHLLLMHGLGDDNVHAQNTLRLVEAFIKAKVTTYDVMLYPKRGHGIGGAGLDVFTRLVEYFERHLGR